MLRGKLETNQAWHGGQRPGFARILGSGLVLALALGKRLPFQ